MGWGFKSLPRSQISVLSCDRYPAFISPRCTMTDRAYRRRMRPDRLRTPRRSRSGKRWISFGRVLALSVATGLIAMSLAEAGHAARRLPNIVLVTVDTLRFDRIGYLGYHRPTSPTIDSLMAAGASFTQARVVEPLTAPSLCSMLTSRHPHEHGASRNGLALRPDLPSLPKTLAARGYRTAAFVGNWTLRDRLSGLGEHFEDYQEVFTRKRWFGMFNAEADADDITDAGLTWLRDHLEDDARWPFLMWVHYVEPHAPYRFHDEHAEALGIATSRGEPSASDRYDTEVAFVDRAIGELMDEVRALVPAEDTMVIFASDHGESLGEHDYWGHGRHLYDATLLIPMSITWPGRVVAGTPIGTPASNLDLAPTVLSLIGLPVPETFRGNDWSPVMTGKVTAEDHPTPRATFHQAHKGATRGGDEARRNGLLEVGWVDGSDKEILRIKNRARRYQFDLAKDPKELATMVEAASPASEILARWLEDVQQGLDAADVLPAPLLDDESLEQLRALGYID